jgi:chromosome segregation ATPase
MEGHDGWDDLRSCIDETRSLRMELMWQTAHLNEQIRHLKIENTSIKADISSMKAEIMSARAELRSTRAEIMDRIEKLQVCRTFKMSISLTDAEIDIILDSGLCSASSTPSCGISQ